MQTFDAAPSRRTNAERTDATRRALLQAARALFVEKGYGATSTPEIVAAAGITRGALYHHFADKLDLLRAVVAQEEEAVAAEIEAAAAPAGSPREALHAGSAGYLAAMQAPGRTRLLLLEGPAVLGQAEMAALDAANSARTLREGLEAALPARDAGALPLQALADLLAAAFDRAALSIQSGADPAAYAAALSLLIDSVLDAPARSLQRA